MLNVAESTGGGDARKGKVRSGGVGKVRGCGKDWGAGGAMVWSQVRHEESRVHAQSICIPINQEHRDAERCGVDWEQEPEGSFAVLA